MPSMFLRVGKEQGYEGKEGLPSKIPLAKAKDSGSDKIQADVDNPIGICTLYHGVRLFRPEFRQVLLSPAEKLCIRGECGGAVDNIGGISISGPCRILRRSEERRVGKECRSRWSP